MPGERHRPAFERVPAYDGTLGDLAAQVGEDLGLAPDPDQRAILDAIFGYRQADPEVPAAFEVGVVAPRQNIKSSTLEVAAATDLFVLREPLGIWSSHLFKSSKAIFKDLVARVEGNREYRRKCRKPRTATGDEALVLTTGEELQFHARSRGGGRGLTARRVTLDEALFLDELHLGALLPTLATVRGAQVRYGSSAALVSSSVLRALRDRGRAGGERIAWFEWAADRRACASEHCAHAPGAAGCAYDDVELWRQANPALGRRITLDTLADLRRSMPPEEWAREFLGWHEEAPAVESGPFDVADWLAMADPAAERGARPAFGVDVNVARVAHVAVAWRRPDGRVQVMLAADDAGRVALSPLELADRLADLAARWGAPVAVGGTSSGVAADVRAASVVTAAEFASACGRFDDLFRERRLRHGNQQQLTDAVRAARWRPFGGAGERTLDLTASPSVGPLAAVVRALHVVLAAPKAPPPPPASVSSGLHHPHAYGGDALDEIDLRTVSF